MPARCTLGNRASLWIINDTDRDFACGRITYQGRTVEVGAVIDRWKRDDSRSIRVGQWTGARDGDDAVLNLPKSIAQVTVDLN